MVTVKIALLNSWNPSEEVRLSLEQLVSLVLNGIKLDLIAFVSLAEDRLLLLLKFVEELLGEAAPLNDEYRQNGTTQVVLGYNSFGKPFLVQPGWKRHTIEFNITHDEQVVMVAGYTRAKDEKNEAGVGIDIMRIDRNGVDAEGLQDVLIEQLHPSELSTFRATFDLSASYNATAETARLNYLIRMWTAKEAYTKAIGTGLGMEFKEIALVGLDHLDRGKLNKWPTCTAVLTFRLQKRAW
ncbi:hypothetical protein QFC24_001306 [Naganishia onofrii]|uniref:Uncharacterized protein n=1 Tax=Naganishia onofrii TaxID=1851511 RepID=A0ACC2XSX5_9TREE|nr:hypothetical protein QFC24_001306 [Naganishia onofrii]